VADTSEPLADCLLHSTLLHSNGKLTSSTEDDDDDDDEEEDL
jgi:hypothetical protein